jgi:plastocyanin
MVARVVALLVVAAVALTLGGGSGGSADASAKQQAATAAAKPKACPAKRKRESKRARAKRRACVARRKRAASREGAPKPSVAPSVAPSAPATPAVPSAPEAPAAAPTQPAAVASTVGVGAYDLGSFVLRLTRLSVPAGALTVYFRNHDVSEHNLWIDGPGLASALLVSGAVGEGATASKNLTVAAGSWRLFCSLPGHEAMSATLTVG